MLVDPKSRAYRIGGYVAIEGKSPADLVRLALARGGLELDGRRYSVPDLTAVARAMRPSCTLVITNSEGKATTDLIALIEAAPGRVIISSLAPERLAQNPQATRKTRWRRDDSSRTC
jgi:uncharacterized membrane protein